MGERSIFRKKSLERVTSPEQLNDYIKVTTPSVWGILVATLILIAHRLSTIKNCDRIIVLDNGKIVEDGTYNELIEKNGYFAELVSRQQVGRTG